MKEKKSDNLAYEYWFAGIRALSAGKKWKLHEQLKSGDFSMADSFSNCATLLFDWACKSPKPFTVHTSSTAKNKFKTLFMR